MAITYPSKGDQKRTIGIEVPDQTENLTFDGGEAKKQELETQLSNPKLTETQARNIRERLRLIEDGVPGVIPQGELGSRSLVTNIGNNVDSKNLQPKEILAGMVNMDGSVDPFELTNRIDELREKHNKINNN